MGTNDLFIVNKFNNDCFNVCKADEVEKTIERAKEFYQRDVETYEHHLIDYPNMADEWRRGLNHAKKVLESGFARQMTMFSENETVADHTNPIVMFLADLLNHSQVTRLKKVFALYNNEAKDAASGQVDMFSGGVKSKSEILSEVKTMFASLSQPELDKRLNNAAFERRIDAVTEISSKSVVADDSPTLPHGVEIGKLCSVILPSHEIVTAKLELIDGEMAGVRLSGYRRIKVPISSLMALLKDVA